VTGFCQPHPGTRQGGAAEEAEDGQMGDGLVAGAAKVCDILVQDIGQVGDDGDVGGVCPFTGVIFLSEAFQEIMAVVGDGTSSWIPASRAVDL
jgi:hypothetical protein